MQLLPPRQRAVLILRDVLGYQASETAHMLGSSEESVTSALRRARVTLKGASGGGAAPPPAPRSTAEQTLVERFVRAFESSDVKGVVGLLTDDVRFTMPPLPAMWHGRDRAGLFLEAMMAWSAQGHRVLQTRANGQSLRRRSTWQPPPRRGAARAHPRRRADLGDHALRPRHARAIRPSANPARGGPLESPSVHRDRALSLASKRGGDPRPFDTRVDVPS